MQSTKKVDVRYADRQSTCTNKRKNALVVAKNGGDNMVKLLSLFSGIGAFEKALQNLDIPFELVAYCEIDKYAMNSTWKQPKTQQMSQDRRKCWLTV